jgi:hypothetical protein
MLFPPRVKSVFVSFITYPVSACGGFPSVGPPVAWQADGPRRTTSNCPAIKQEPWPAWNLPASGISGFHGTKTKCSLLYLYPGTIPNFARDGFGVERLHGEGSAMPGNQINLNSDHNRAIRAEIGYQLRVLLSKEQSRPPPGVQRLLDFLSALDATTGRTPTTRY